MAADLADHHLLLGQVHGGFADVQALEPHQRPAIRGLDREGCNVDRYIAQQQLGFLGQAEFVVGTDAHDAVFEVQWHGVAHIGPKGFHLAISDFQLTFGGDRDQAEVAGPVDLSAIGADGHQGHVGTVIGQGAEVLQLEIECVVDKLDGLAGPGIFKVHGAARQFDSLDAQRKRLGIRVGGCGFVRWQFEQPQQIEFAILAEQDFGLGLVQFDIGQVHRLGPQAVELQIGIQAFETDLLLTGLADVQAPKGQFKAERIEFDPLDRSGCGGVVGQLLVGNAQRDTR
ncbi:hypothetical protein D3C87_1132350 [compost metagenome]